MDDTARSGLERCGSLSSAVERTPQLARCLEEIKRACIVLEKDKNEDREVVTALQSMRLSVEFKSESELEMLRNDRSCIVIQDFSTFLETRESGLLYYGPTCIKRASAAAAAAAAQASGSASPDQLAEDHGDDISVSASSASDQAVVGATGLEAGGDTVVGTKTRKGSSGSDVQTLTTCSGKTAAPQLPFTGHSMLTTLLLGKRCCLQVGKREHVRYRAQVYALGGRLAKRVQDANLLVTPCAWGDQYRLARTFETPVVAPGLLDALWEQRDSLDFELTDYLIEKYRLPVFSRIKMRFVGFENTAEDQEQLRQRAMANGAAIVGQVSREGTYVVVVSRTGCSLEDLQELHRELSIKSAIVFEDWFYDSISQGYALCEKNENYDARRLVATASASASSALCGSPHSGRKRGAGSPGIPPRSKKSMESLLLSPRVEELSRLDSCSGVFSPATGAASPIRTSEITDRRHLVLIELRDTEANYLKILEFIMRMATRHLGELDSDKKHPKGPHQSDKEREEIITRFERQEIFKEIPNIIALHRTLLGRMEAAVKDADFRNIAPIFHGEDACGLLPEPEAPKASKKRPVRKSQPDKTVKENKIVATYKTFLNGLETIKERVKTLLAENPRFAEFVRTVEEQPECNREKFLHLLIRPVQRWPSILNLLKRYSDESEKMAKRLEDSIKSPSAHEARLRTEVAQIRLGGQDALRVHRFIEESLRQMNDYKSQTLMICEALKTQNTIEDIPAMYWSEQYTLNHHCDAILVATSETLTQTYGQKPLKNAEVACFLFSHGLEIARKKVNNKNHKPYRHVAFIHFDKINTLLVNVDPDPTLHRLLEIVFREQRKEICPVASSMPTLSPISMSIKDGISELDGGELETLPAGTDLGPEYTEERVLLDFKDPQSKDLLMTKMDAAYKNVFNVERIVTLPTDRKEGLRSDSLLLTLSHAHHANTPVTQLARSLSNVSEMSTPKKLTRTFSNLIKKGLLGASNSNKAVREETASPRSPPGTAMQFNRNRHGVSISSTSLQPPRLGGSSSSAHHRSSISLLSNELSSSSSSSSPSRENEPPSPSQSAERLEAILGPETDQTDANSAVAGGGNSSSSSSNLSSSSKTGAKRKKVEGGFALPVGRAPISPKWVRRSLSISRRAVGAAGTKRDKLDV